ncbi:MAG: hypothetical protein JNL58_17460 [Planctomyces sp.]|nr:hypothetical protein [Planctomyces sp.]
MANENPYSVSPGTVQQYDPFQGHQPTRFYVDLPYIQCGPEVVLPPVCVRTGVQEDLVEIRRKSIYYVHPAVYIALIGGLLPLLILYLVLRKKVVVTYFIARRVRTRQILGTVFGLLGLVGSFVLMIVLVDTQLPPEIVVPVFLVTMVGSLILMLISQPPITVKKHDSSTLFWLKGFKPPFFDSLRRIFRPNESNSGR